MEHSLTMEPSGQEFRVLAVAVADKRANWPRPTFKHTVGEEKPKLKFNYAAKINCYLRAQIVYQPYQIMIRKNWR